MFPIYYFSGINFTMVMNTSIKSSLFLAYLGEVLNKQLAIVTHQKNLATQQQQFEEAYTYRMLERKLNNMLLDLELIEGFQPATIQ